MIDTETIEIIFQFTETFLPPGEIIFLHHIPIIGREPPVLTIYGEIVGRSTGLTVHIKVFRFHPCLDTRTVHSYRQIAFQHDPVLAGIIGNALKLGMQDILQEIQERYFRICLASHGTKFTNSVLIEYGVLFPLREVGSPVHVTQVAIGGIRHQPGLVLREKLPIFRGGQDRLALLPEVFPAIFQLISNRLFVIDGIQSIQLCLFPGKKGRLFRICQLSQIGQADIHRMKGVNRNGAIRIRIGTGMRRRRVVHRKHLDDTLTRFPGPIHQHTQIPQVTDSEALLRT